jgi:nitroreductase
VNRTVLAGFLLAVFLAAPPGAAQELAPITLPAPQTDIGMPLMQALAVRQTIRQYSDRALPPQELSNLLWAANGVNRPGGYRTAPNSSNRQEIDIYVVLEEGAYRYDAVAHTLEPVATGDHRAATATQPGFAEAPLNLLFVADLLKRDGTRESDTRQGRLITVSADAACISQNVYVYCASQGLATVVRYSVDRAACAKFLNLDPERFYITYAQTVGYPR